MMMLLVSHQVVSDSSATLWTVALQAPLSMELSRQDTGVPFPLQGIFPTHRSNPLQACSLPAQIWL